MNQFRSINLCMDKIEKLNSKISSLKTKIATIGRVINKNQYIQETISFSINGSNFTLCKATQSGTETKRGAEMVILGIKKMLNEELWESEKDLKQTKEALITHANSVNDNG